MPASNELLNDIKTVLDITSRVDERVKVIQTNQQELNVRLNQFIGEFNQLSSRVSVLESKNGGRIHIIEEQIDELSTKFERMDAAGSEVFIKNIEKSEKHRGELDNKINMIHSRIQELEHSSNGWQNKAKQYGSLVIQGIWVVIVCFILFKLGLTTSPLP